MLLLMKGRILLESPIYLLPGVSVLNKLLLCTSRHVVYVALHQVVIVYELVAHYSITMFIDSLQIRPRIRSLKYCDHLVPNKRSVYNERVGEWYDSFRVTSKRRRPTED